MKDEIFEWDDDKALINFRKHGISFEEARGVFEDPYAITVDDATHSEFEPRYVTIGLSLISRVLIVVHTDREYTIRIISARKATPSERAQYESQR
ncbi:MAG TPA: BrnT family toxin [Alloacidobacterium sp.]|nr:BrnT family toxin [Alloacidobacterium sp.]